MMPLSNAWIYIALYDRMVINNKVERTQRIMNRKEVAVAHFKVPSQNLHGGTREYM
jgi:hypothetical protein